MKPKPARQPNPKRYWSAYIVWEFEYDDTKLKEYTFKSKAERDAFLMGVSEAESLATGTSPTPATKRHKNTCVNEPRKKAGSPDTLPFFPWVQSGPGRCRHEENLLQRDSDSKRIIMFESIKAFSADQFTATKWDKADKKANFARQFIRFVESDFDRAQFPNAFYVRLAMTFGNIAHYNQAGFFEEFFTSTERKVRFLRKTMQHSCPGDPAWTYSDVERVLQSWLLQNRVLENYERRIAQETEAAERAELAWLKNKYEKGTVIRQPGQEAG